MANTMQNQTVVHVQMVIIMRLINKHKNKKISYDKQ